MIGLLEVYPCGDLDVHQQLFFEKYANRIGFNVHMRFLLKKYGEHVSFIKGLVGDIEHNVIVPNMVYNLYLKRLSGKIKKNKEIEDEIRAQLSAPEADREAVAAVLAELSDVNQGLAEELANIQKHYRATSLFLETLLRKKHFDEGRLTLRTESCDINEAVIIPQFERFAERFAQKGVSVNDGCGGIPEDETKVVIDVGLISQVYANLFSNALKYVGRTTGEDGRSKKAVCYGRQRLKDYFGPGKNGIKYNVFTTGRQIPEAEREKVFHEGYRGAGAMGRPGTGHGLAFVKNAVELHSGVTGYEPVPGGNNFYFILPE
jgi:signal transduction histidine kinase